MGKKTVAAILIIILCVAFIYSYKVMAQIDKDQKWSGMIGLDMMKYGMLRMGGIAWGARNFDSNGKRIYFKATSEHGAKITYTDEPVTSNRWMMKGRLACVSCHGPYGKGGRRIMGTMQMMYVMDIRWPTLQPEFDAEKFSLAVVKGQDSDGSPLEPDMPHWNISDDDLADLIDFLKTLP